MALFGRESRVASIFRKVEGTLLAGWREDQWTPFQHLNFFRNLSSHGWNQKYIVKLQSQNFQSNIDKFSLGSTSSSPVSIIKCAWSVANVSHVPWHLNVPGCGNDFTWTRGEETRLYRELIGWRLCDIVTANAEWRLLSKTCQLFSSFFFNGT